MPSTTCLASPLFSLSGESYFTSTDTAFELVLNDPADAGLVQAVEWYLDGLLIIGESALTLSGKVPCGQHTVSARLLAGNSWSGLQQHTFQACTSYTLNGPSYVNEGGTATYTVTASYADGSTADVAGAFTFSATDGSFSGNVFTAPANDGPPGDTPPNITVFADGLAAHLEKSITLRNMYGAAGILVVDLFNNAALNAIGMVHNAEVANNHVAAYTGHNTVPAGATPAAALILASDYIPQTTLNWRFEFNLNKLINENPGTNLFTFIVKGRSGSPGSISGAYVLKTFASQMALNGSPGSYLPTTTGSNIGESVPFGSYVTQSINGSYDEAGLLPIITLHYNVATKSISHTTA